MEKQIVITDSYMSSVGKLTNQERRQALSTIKQMRMDLSIPSLKVHAINREKCDPSFRSARVTSDLRIIFSINGEFCTLLYIDHHDAAYDWCVGKFLKRTDFGAAYIFDMLKENQSISLMEEEEVFEDEESLLDQFISAKEICKLGINSIHADNLLKISDEDTLLEYISIFPEELQEAIIDIYSGLRSFEEVYNELLEKKEIAERANITADSLLHEDSRRRFYVTQSMEELEYLVMHESFEKWTTFLHPSQEYLAKIRVNGPVLIEGGPGTGKTVLGMHRAAFLSQYVYPADQGKKILFCTFSKKLAKSIAININKLYAQKGIKMNVDIMGIDAFIVQQLGSNGLYVNMQQFERLMKQVFNSRNWERSFSFYHYEYFQVIERYGITSREQYLLANRKGMGTPLNANQREKVWEFFKELFKKQREANISTFVNRAEKLEMLIDSGKIAPMYDSIIIDEAQDLEPAKLRLLGKCTKNKKDGLMILSDFNQRIFNLLTWKGDTDLDVVGRTFYLSINYRTTKEICDYASALFFKGKGRNDAMRSYKSIVKGHDPIVQGYKNELKQWEAIIATISDLEKQRISLNNICVIFPTKIEMDKFIRELDRHNKKYIILQDDVIPEEAQDDQVCLCLTKGVKGLEFMFVVMASSEKIGIGIENRYFSDDKAKESFVKQMDCERYVAATRARDNLVVTYVEES